MQVPAKVTFQLRDRAAAQRLGVNGLLFTAGVPKGGGGGGGKVAVSVDYSAFGDAFGGDWSSRLRLVELPACALTTPAKPACRVQTPVRGANDAAASRLTGTVELAKPSVSATARSAASASAVTVMAATSDSSSGAGDYSATPFAPSGSWSAGGNSGDFTYSYPVSVPPSPGGLTPDVGLSYSAQSVDGRMTSTDNQPSWVGEGWDYSPGAVTRSYVPCKDDPAGTAPKTSDLCWDGQILHIVFDGHSQDIVYDASVPTHWKLSDDTTAKVEFVVAGNTTQNDTYDGDYWKITSNGRIYYYGRNTIPGYGATNSAWTAPVYGAHSGDPCYNATFAKASCKQAWQWNLDEVVDVHGNAMVYYYGTHTNYYGADGATTGVKYTRAGWLDHIDYGLGNGSTVAPQRVQFVTDWRCTASTCLPIDSHTSSWPDVPWDLNCNSGAACSIHSPTFFSTKRLTSIKTQILSDPTAKTYSDVDTYALAHSFPNPNDGNEKPALWLDSITHTGANGTPITLPAVKFTPINLANRFNVRSGYANLNKFRISGIATESGDAISVNYQAPTGCSTSTVPSTNTTQCFPVYWTPYGQTTPILDWFDKYVVASVSDNDNTGASAGTVTSYKYTGKAAWHYDDNEIVKPKFRTYAQWRGYSEVETRTGTSTDGQTLTHTIYYQGMNGDTMPSGTRSASVVLSNDVPVPGAVKSVPDTAQLAGSPRESIVYKGSGGSPANATVSSYWVSGPTATRSRSGLPALTANMVRPAQTITTTAITSKSTATWRTTQATSSYDKTSGLLRYVDDKGDVSVPAQETCTTDKYAPGLDSWNLTDLVGEVEMDAGPCGAGDSSTSDGLGYPSANRPADVVSDIRTYYDTPAPTDTTVWPMNIPASQSTPTLGEPTLVATADGYSSGSFTYEVNSVSDYDAWGRPTSAWDALGDRTRTAYTTANGQTTKVTVTNAKLQTSSTTLDPARGSTTATTDANNAETDTAYDGLGRVTATWLPGRDKATQSADYTYAYQVSATSPSSVTTKELQEDGGYATGTRLYDGLLRLRQTQSQTPQGGRLLTDAYYDSHGWTYKTNHGYWDGSSSPNTTLVATTDPQVTNQEITTFDGLGQPVRTVSQYKGTAKETTRTVYGGDQVTVIPPTGGTPTTTVTDGRGRTVETDAYASMPTVTGDQVTGGSPEATTFTYDAVGSHGKMTAITDPALNQRTFTYDLLGQKVRQTDPDTGTTSMGYDADGRLKWTKDGRGSTVSLDYDVLGRKTAEYDGADSSAPKLADWAYDAPTVPNSAGHETSSTHYDADHNAFTTAVTGYNVHGDPTGTTTTVPDSVTGLAGAYTYAFSYTPTLGLPLSTSYPAAGNLPAEKVYTGYNSLGLPTSVGGLSTYTSDTHYDAYSRVSQTSVGTLANTAAFTDTYDDHTGALNNANVSRSTAPQTVQDTTYTRDLAGNVTRITDNRLGSASDTQCFRYNLLGRMTDAWTGTDACAGAPSTTGATPTVGGPDPYWSTWTFDANGNRATQVQHAVAGQTGDTTTDYSYGKPGAPTQQPDTLTGTSTTHADHTVTDDAYTYDDSGNTATRTTTPGTDTLHWDDEGKLTSLKSTGQDNPTTYAYDADGSQLLRTDPDGKKTLFLPGQEVTYDPAGGGALSGTRYISLPGGVTCTRTGAGAAYNYVASNDQATGTASLNSTAQTPTFRLFDPYGNPRGSQPGSWPGDKGFIGGTEDETTGLTHLGARDYDPALGRFVSADPLFEATDPNQIGGYAYAGDNPVTSSDPTGLMETCGAYGTACYPDDWNNDGSPNQDNDRSTNEDDDHSYCTTHSCGSPSSGSSSGNSGGRNSGGTGHRSGNGKHQDHHGSWLDHFGGAGHWISEHGPALGGMGAELLTGAGCYAGSVAGAPETGGASLAGVALCGAAAADAGTVTEEWLSGGVSTSDSLKDQATSMAWGATLALGGELAAEKLAMRAARGSCNSFLPAADVLLADGTKKDIASVKIGDRVLATDPVSGTAKAEKVTDVIVTKADKDFTDLTVHTEAGDSTLTSTQHHPYWDSTRRQWVNAADLKPGEHLRQPDAAPLTITAVRNYHRTSVTYNLTVDRLHTYYVLAGATPILVHNCPEDLTPDYARKAYKRPTTGVRNAAIAKSPTCPYCDASPSTEFEHVDPQKGDWDRGGWLSSRDVRSRRVNDPGNTTGACRPCNASKQDKSLGEGSGQWWPNAWPSGVWWPFGGKP
ncbi:RHS repeat-associated core domain-containing protein [Streptomyces sp. NPDC046985]|uniref:RHS repeat-associated core domain-containing protein n=1 Tax=Streptomyces sp. NPDC046985 TaxID=3155377 RepID=UPI0033CAA76E